MNQKSYIRLFSIAALLLLLPLCVVAQDTTLNRNVTVERDFQPIISKDDGKAKKGKK